MDKVILIVPCFNEQKRFNKEYFEAILRNPKVIFVFINDGSMDSTPEILFEFCRINSKRALFMNLEENCGKANAVRAGILRSSSFEAKYFGFLDADGAFPVGVVNKGLNQVFDLSTEFETFWFSRVMLAGSQIERRWHRHFFGRVLMTVITFRLQYCPYDTQAGFKIFRNTNQNLEIFQEVFQTRWLFDIEIFLRMQSRGLTKGIKEIPVDAWQDVEGSKLSTTQILKILREVFTLLRLRAT